MILATYRNVLIVFLLILLVGCKQVSRWFLTEGPESNASPAIVGHQPDGNIYVATINSDGLVVYAKTSAPTIWSTWQSIGTAPEGVFSPDTAPILISDETNNEIRIYARGSDNNLYRAIKKGNSAWGNWINIINEGNVNGRFSVSLTFNTPQSIPEEHIVYVSDVGCEYHRLLTGSGHTDIEWENCEEAVISGNGKDEVGIALRYDNTLDFKRIRRSDVILTAPTISASLVGKPTQLLSNWTLKNLKTLSRKFFSLSSLVNFDASYHLVLANRQVTDDVGPSYKFRLLHVWFDKNTGGADLREVATYDPQDSNHALPELVVYRNKLLTAWTASNGAILSARWDNADPQLPWIRYGKLGEGVGQHKPSIASFDRRGHVPEQLQGQNHYGNDAYAVISGKRENGRPEFIIISRAMMRKDMIREITVYNSNSDNLNPVCRAPDDEFGPEKVNNLWTDDRIIISEIGFNLWAFPNGLIGKLYSDFTEWMCTSPNGQWQDGQTPCQTERLPVYVKEVGGIFNCGGAWINRDNSYIRVWEEMGHYFAPALGFGTAISPNQELADISGISLQALQAGRVLFLEDTGTCPTASPRCTGFTGYGGNYDNGGVEHSFMYTMYYYLTKGDEIRALIAEDLAIGNDLLLRKYNWIKQHIFKGIEYRNNLVPV